MLHDIERIGAKLDAVVRRADVHETY